MLPLSSFLYATSTRCGTEFICPFLRDFPFGGKNEHLRPSLVLVCSSELWVWICGIQRTFIAWKCHVITCTVMVTSTHYFTGLPRMLIVMLVRVGVGVVEGEMGFSWGLPCLLFWCNGPRVFPLLLAFHSLLSECWLLFLGGYVPTILLTSSYVCPFYKHPATFNFWPTTIY